LKGAFCAVILDEDAQQLLLISDLLGSFPLYWFDGSERFIFASELKAVLRDPKVYPTLNPRAVADYLTYGFLFGDKTLAEQVRLLPPASMLTFCWSNGHCTLERYAHLQDLFQPWQGSYADYLEELYPAFNQAVRRTLTGNHTIGLSLSGGLDSRMILSAIAGSHTPISTYTLGVKGCADEVVAEQLSSIAGTIHRFYELDTHYLIDFLHHLREMVCLTDGMYLTHGLTEMLALRSLEQADFSVLLRGHGGELAKASLAWPFHTNERIYRMRSKDEFIPYLLERVNYISRDVPLLELFSEKWYPGVADGARSSLEESLHNVELDPVDLCSYLYLAEHHRRFTIASLELFRNLMEVRLPFVDPDFLAILFRSPARWRDDTTLHQSIIRQNMPTLLRIRDSNTGAPVNAGPLLETILDKFNSLFRRLNLYGYRHYHHFDRWMRQMLITSVEEVLLSSESLNKGLYRETVLRRVIHDTKRGITDHSYLLQILLILEIWQQEYL
jgi:asparagine synthase (glutamine-hydrolysing)